MGRKTGNCLFGRMDFPFTKSAAASAMKVAALMLFLKLPETAAVYPM